MCALQRGEGGKTRPRSTHPVTRCAPRRRLKRTAGASIAASMHRQRAVTVMVARLCFPLLVRMIKMTR